MKKLLIIPALALFALTSCTKERDYLCRIETYDPRGIAPGPKVRIVNFHGTYPAMRAYEAANTWGDSTHVQGDAPLGDWQTCHCR